MRTLIKPLFSFVVIWTMFFLRANVWFRLYPAVVVTLALALFAGSLLAKETVVEHVARKMGEELDARGVAYCRKVTVAWVVFLSLHLVVTLATVFWTSRTVWAWYNGCIAYVLIAGMFVGELIFRHRAKSRRLAVAASIQGCCPRRRTWFLRSFWQRLSGRRRGIRKGAARGGGRPGS